MNLGAHYATFEGIAVLRPSLGELRCEDLLFVPGK
jgi:hypothetical protein